MKYSILTPEAITPEKVLIHNAYGEELRENANRPQLPEGTDLYYTNPDYNRFSADPEKRKILVTDPNGSATFEEILAAFPGIKEQDKSRIRAEGSKRLEALAAPYTPQERETWANQQKEAEAWTLDQTVATPMVDAMATVRGIDKAAMMGKILENVGLFRAAAGQILGEQQRLLDQIDAAGSLEEVRGVTW